MNKNLQTTLFVIVFAISFGIMMGTTNIAVNAQNSQKQTQQTFQAKPSGNNGLPPVTTSATGIAQFQLSTNGKALSYTLTANNIKYITASHIHQGKTGEKWTASSSTINRERKNGLWLPMHASSLRKRDYHIE